MKNIASSVSITAQVTGAVTGLILATTLFQVLFFPARQSREAEAGLAAKATAIAELLANSTSSALDFGDAKLAEDVLSGAERDKDLAYAGLYAVDERGDGKLFASGKRSRSSMSEKLSLAAALVSERTIVTKKGGNLLEVVARVQAPSPSGTKGVVIAAFSTEGIAAASRHNQLVALVIGALILGLGLLVGYAIGVYVRRHIRAMEEIAARVAEMALQIRASSEEMLASTRQQEQGATEQSSAVEETRRTMEGLLGSSVQISKTADGVLQNAELTQRNNQLIAERIGALSARTQRINEILEVIKDIANKSELLALNAALEGTKAGEAGRGFSLVATHMQRLAENVMGAVGDIKNLTVDIREATNSSVLATEEGTKLASDTTRSARQIALIMQQQQSGTEQVSKAMDDVSQVAQQTAASSKQSVEAIAALTALAERLEELVRGFGSGSAVERGEARGAV